MLPGRPPRGAAGGAQLDDARALRHPGRLAPRRLGRGPRGRRRSARVLGASKPRAVPVGSAEREAPWARSLLIVVGLMLGTAIIAAALTTGDTMSHTIRQAAVKGLGEADLVIAARGATQDLQGELGQATGVGYFDESVVEQVEGAVAGRDLVDGVTGVVIEQVAVQAPRQRQSEPSVVVVAPDPARMDGFAAIEVLTGGQSPRGARAGRALPERRGRRGAPGTAGDEVLVYAANRDPFTMRVREVVEFDGTVTADAALIMSLAEAQRGSATRTRSTRCSSRTAAGRSRRALGRGGRRAPRRAVGSAGRGLDDEAGHPRGRRRGRQRLHGVLHHLRDLLDRRRDPADLPDLRHARRGAAR